MILVVCALASELRGWRPPAGVALLAAGVGPVEAAVATAAALATGDYRAVVNAGIAGAFPGRARVGDALVVVRETLAGLGLEGGEPLALPEGAALVDRVDADPELVTRAAAAGLRAGDGLTVVEVTTTAARGAVLAARYDADVESMEGFAVLRAARRAGVPAIEVRGISNYVGARADSAWDFGAGARAAASALATIVAAIA